jgi:lipopolysaccharide transport system permease protein
MTHASGLRDTTEHPARELWRYRELLYFLAWRDVMIRYKQASLGAAWAVLQPLLAMLIFTFFFGRIAKFPSDGIPYSLFSYSGLVLWTFFAASLGSSGNSLVSNSSLITKVYFPRLLLPFSSILGGVLDLGVGASFLGALFLWHHVMPSWTLILAPVFVVQLILLALGIGTLLAALNVRFRDVKHAIPFVTQIWMFLTPIIYPVSFLPEQYRPLLALNPVAGIVQGFRAAIFGTVPFDWFLIGTSWAITLLLLFVGTTYFRKTEKAFADIV